jgi:putative peptide zinc metalloprotease protein
LRAELRVLSYDDASGGVVFDPFTHRYFRIGPETARLLSLWPYCRTMDDLAEAAAVNFGTVTSAAELQPLVGFLQSNALTLPGSEQERCQLTERSRAQRQSWFAWIIHNYLFIKIPLLAPQTLLTRLAGLTQPLYTRTCATLIAAAGLVGLYLVSRQWDRFLTTFTDFLSMEGALTFSIALMIVKSLHELGHGVTAVRYGCNVPSMGVCFMLLTPMLYTDVSDAWKLKSRRARLAIHGAGIAVETAIACVATLAWAFLPEGPFRALAFAMATTSWVLSLGLNLNPFMRFDGYFLLSDVVGFDNLQPRSFEFGTWKLRELLFDLRAPPPEPVTARQRYWLTLYAWSVWLYRLVLFTGIALLVYHFAFKLLGIVLFLIEIIYFVAGPIWREIKEWYQMRALIRERSRSWYVLSAAAISLLLTLLPISTTIAIPAVLEDRELAPLHARRPSVVRSIHVRQGDPVTAGATIIELFSPDLENEIRMTQLRIQQTERRLHRRTADVADRHETLVLQSTRDSLTTKLSGLEKEKAELTIIAATDGLVAELQEGLAPGRWLQPTDLIALIAGRRSDAVRGYVSEADVARLDTSAPARFIPDSLMERARDVVLTGVAAAGTTAMDLVELSSHYGGGVSARPVTGSQGQREQVPVVGQFLIAGDVGADSGDRAKKAQRGVLLARGHPESIAARAWRQVLNVLVRESGV